MSDEPLVSVCIPAYNAERWIGAAIESVLEQTYTRFELLISDGGSTDRTAQVVESYADPRIRLDIAPHRLGAIANWNRSVLLSTGSYIKFLHQDDTILPTCIEVMLALAIEDPEIGLVFARREIVLEEEARAEDRVWAQTYADIHRHFTALSRINEGRALFRQLLDADLQANWIGEPSSVLATRSTLARTGLFNPRLRQMMDLELWCRAMLRARIGFVDRVLSTYLHHANSLTGQNARLGQDWLDRVWFLEGLLAEELPPEDSLRVGQLRDAALKVALRAQVARLARRRFSAELVHYAAYRARAALGKPPALYPSLPVPGA